MTGIADIFIFVAMGIVYYAFLRAIGGVRGHEESPDEHSRDKDIPPEQLDRDPVCGEKIYAPAVQHHSEHFGRTYHFCSNKCMRIFDLNPGRFTSSPLPG